MSNHITIVTDAAGSTRFWLDDSEVRDVTSFKIERSGLGTPHKVTLELNCQILRVSDNRQIISADPDLD